MAIIVKALLLTLLGVFSGCTTLPPKDLSDACVIFEEKKRWYKVASKARDKWQLPIGTGLAFIHQESRFRAKAKPPRRKILWIFPGPRLSSSYGYSQAKNSTWDWYRESTGNRRANRDNMADAIDFIGWYNSQTKKRNGISLTDTYSLYLAYHEGHGGFKRGTYKNKKNLKSVASKVTRRASMYEKQLKGCEENLQSSGWWPF